MNKIVDNKCGILKDEITVLELFINRINYAIKNNKRVSIKVAVGFFFFEGFEKVYKYLNALYSKGLLKEFKLIMGSETKSTTKEALLAIKNDVSFLGDEAFQFLKKLNKENIAEIKVYLERRFHLKIFLFEFNNELEVWAGSANFTHAGLESNIELMVDANTSTIEKKELYRKFFNSLWEKASDELEKLKIIQHIKNFQGLRVIKMPPREFITNLLKILNKEYLVHNIVAEASYLAEFQNMSYHLCLERLKKYGGVILSNSVGLGKTDVSCMIGKYYYDLNKKILMIYPPAVKHNWLDTMKKVGIDTSNITWLSMGMLQQRDFKPNKYKGYDIIIVDEAHNFRNPNSNRNKSLNEIIRYSPESHVLLVTATPINTSLLNFTELIKMFLKGTYKTRFESEGIIREIASIENHIRKKEKFNEAVKLIKKLTREYSVRIEWSDLTEHFKEDLIKISGVSSFSPPIVKAIKYKYSEDISKTIFDPIVDFLDNINYEYTKLWEDEYKDDKNLIWWYKWRLYKRLESSILAFIKSLENIKKRNEYLVNYLKNPEIGIDKNLFPEDRLNTISSTYKNQSQDLKNQIISNLTEDKVLADTMLNSINKVKDLKERDNKIEKLLKVLEHENRPTIIFSESKDTVFYIGESLKKHTKISFQMAYGGEMLTEDEEGNETIAEISKRKIEKEFNQGKFQVLVTTDVLSEGVNLPHADVVINFDIPYNPVKLVQRDGRAIRINNLKQVKIYNFEPDERIDKELAICDKLNERVEDIVSTIGIDFMVWSVEQGNLEELNNKNRDKILNLIKKYKQLLAEQSPDKISKGMSPTFSEEDKELRAFIRFYNISKETIEKQAKNYNKPIFTSLQGGGEYFYSVYKYKENIYTNNELSFSNMPADETISKGELNLVYNEVEKSKKALDKGTIKTGIAKNQETRRIEKLIKNNKDLTGLLNDIDIASLPRETKRQLKKLIDEFLNADMLNFQNKLDEIEMIVNNIKKDLGVENEDDDKPIIKGIIKYV